MTTKWLLDTWGEPDEKVHDSDSVERWTYDRRLRWNGLFAVVVIIPVPLIVPVGYESDTFLVKDGVVESVDRVRQYTVSYLYGALGSDTPYRATDNWLERTENGRWVQRDQMPSSP